MGVPLRWLARFSLDTQQGAVRHKSEAAPCALSMPGRIVVDIASGLGCRGLHQVKGQRPFASSTILKAD
jgi:hypothetical protein